MTGRKVLLVHGFWSDANAWTTFINKLQDEGIDTMTVELGNTNQSIPDMAQTFQGQIESLAPNRSVDVVAHSMGGLVTRYYIKNMASDDRIKQLICLGTPNHGTPLAKLSKQIATSAQQMVPGSDFLQDLNSGTETPGNVTYTTIAGTDTSWTKWLHMLDTPHDGVVEASSVSLDGATHHQVHSTHAGLHEDHTPIELVISQLNPV